MALVLVLVACNGEPSGGRACDDDAVIADVAVTLQGVDDTGMTNFVVQNFDPNRDRVAGMRGYTVTTSYGTRTVFIYLPRRLDDDARGEVRGDLERLGAVDSVRFEVEQAGGISPSAPGCDS